MWPGVLLVMAATGVTQPGWWTVGMPRGGEMDVAARWFFQS